MPILDALTPADLDNLKLANGLKIWEPLWSHRQPQVKIFNTPVKHIAKCSSAGSLSTVNDVTSSPCNRPSIQVSAENQDKQTSSIYMGRIDEQSESKVLLHPN